mgnify:CR=1 FL=1
MLLVLVQQVIEDLLVKQGDALKIISRPWLKRDNLVNETVGLVAQVCDVLLSQNFLLDISRVIADL